ncbi:MAG TPA: AMP-binding protein [Methylomirabilota bacterium]
MAASLQVILHERVDQAPSDPALAFVDSQGRFAWQSRGDIHDRAAGYSAALLEQGLRPGDVCLLALPSTESCATLLVATLLLGAVPLLVAPPVLPGRESFLIALIRVLIRKTGARLVIVPATLTDLDEITRGHGESCPVVRDTDLSPLRGTRIPRIAPAEKSTAVLQLTSGTTGSPRICVWTQTAVVASLEGMALAMRLREGDVCLNWTPLYHDMGLANNFLLCLTQGIPLALLSPTDFIRNPALWLRGLSDTGSTVTWSPNFGFALAARKVRDHEVEGVRLERVRAFWNAAERIHLDTLESFHRRFAPLGVRLDALKTNYGCAENVGGATFSDPDGVFTVERVDERLLQEKGIARPLPEVPEGTPHVSVIGVGRPCPGIRIHILSRTGRPLRDGQIGEVALETPSQMREYLGHARGTRRALRDGYLRTGDLGYLRDGELFWVGRLRERIMLRGRKLDPSEFERVLLKIPGLRHGCFVAFGVDDPEHGTQRVIVAVEIADPALDPDGLSAAIRGEVHRQLGVTVDDLLLVLPGTLVKTSSGKRRHRVFRKAYLTGELRAAAFVDQN